MWVPDIKLFQPTVIRNGIHTKSPVWVMRWRTPHGNRESRTTGTTNLDAAKLKRAAFLDELLRGCVDPTAPYDKKSWMKTVDEFTNERQHVLRNSTIELYDHCGNVFDKTAKPKRLQDINTAMVEKFAAARAKIGQAPTSVNKELRHVRAVLKWALRRQYIAAIPDFSGAFVREDRKLPVVVPAEHYQAILQTVDDPATRSKLRFQSAEWWRVFVRLAYSLGCRRGELLGLTWKKVDLVGKTLLVSYDTSKGRKDRRLPLVGDLADVLADWKKSQDAAPEDLLLPCSSGMRQIYEDWWLLCKLAKVGTIKFKHFRSTCASELLMSGCSTVTAKEFSGHSTTLGSSGTMRTSYPACGRQRSNGSNGSNGSNLDCQNSDSHDKGRVPGIGTRPFLLERCSPVAPFRGTQDHSCTLVT